MDISRRHLVTASAIAGAASAAPALAAPSATPSAPIAPSLRSSLGIEAVHLGVRPGSPDDQSELLQRALDLAAGARVPLVLGAGVYRAGNLKLMTGGHLIGVRGATRLLLAGGPSLISGVRANDIALVNLTLEGGGRALPEGRGLIHLEQCEGVRITDCEIKDAGRNGIVLESVAGEVTGTTVSSVGETAIFSRDARGLAISRNVIRGAGNNGIQVWRSEAGDDGTLILDNRIDGIRAEKGGSGQYGNGINLFRAGNVSVRGNRIGNCAFSAVRGNAAANLQVVANHSTASGEVAIYAEFGFEGALIANNIIDGAALGIVVTNFNEGGRLAVVQGNLVRNLKPTRPAGTDPNDSAGIGIGVEADSAVTGNVIENAPTAGISVGAGQYLRDVAVTGNVVRLVGIGIAVSVANGAGAALIADNLIAGAKRGAIVGMEWKKPVTGDLAVTGAARYAHLAISGNRVR